MNKFILLFFDVLLLLTFYVPWFGDRSMIELRVVDLFTVSGWFFVMFIITLLGIFAESENVKKFSILGIIGILALAIYEFFMWYNLTITGYVSLTFSLDMTLPEFYISIIIFIVNIVLRISYLKKDKNIKYTQICK